MTGAKNAVPAIVVMLTLSLSLSLAGCGEPSRETAPETETPAAVIETNPSRFNGTVVADPPFSLPRGTFTDTSGRRITFAKEYTEGVTALFFGFTNCDDVCPTAMADLAEAKRRLGSPDASKVRIVFVTVDPARDTPPVLRQWLNGFDRQIIGLSAPRSTVHAAEKGLYAPLSGRAVEQDGGHHSPGGDPGGHDDYDVDHTGSVYVFGPRAVSLLYTGGTLPTEYAADFELLLRE